MFNKYGIPICFIVIIICIVYPYFFKQHEPKNDTTLSTSLLDELPRGATNFQKLGSSWVSFVFEGEAFLMNLESGHFERVRNDVDN